VAVLGIVAILLATITLASQEGQAKADEGSKVKILNNSDVVNLVKAGLDNSVVVAKIKQAPEVDFKLEADDLVALKAAGVSSEIISAMLARTTPAEDQPKAAPPFNGFGPGMTNTAVLITREGRKDLSPSHGEMSTAGFAYFQSVFFNYPGLHASVQTNDRRPSLLIHSEFDPNEHYFIGKLDPDTKINARSLKIKNKGHGFSMGAGVRPDEDWMVPYTASEEEKGVWKMTPTADLQPGEYGLFDGFRLFGFSVGQ
jgi:hypothetical protein